MKSYLGVAFIDRGARKPAPWKRRPVGRPKTQSKGIEQIAKLTRLSESKVRRVLRLAKRMGL